MKEKHAVLRYLESNYSKLLTNSSKETSFSESLPDYFYSKNSIVRTLLKQACDKFISDGLCVPISDKYLITQNFNCFVTSDKENFVSSWTSSKSFKIYPCHLDKVNHNNSSLKFLNSNHSRPRCTVKSEDMDAEQNPVDSSSGVLNDRTASEVLKVLSNDPTPKQKIQVGRKVKKKEHKQFQCSKNKSESSNLKKGSTVLVNSSDETSPIPSEGSAVKHCSTPDVTKMPESPNLPKPSVLVGRKKFILPLMSARSCRKIIPHKKYIDDDDFPVSVPKKKRQLENAELSASDGGQNVSSGAVNAVNKHSSALEKPLKRKKSGLLDQPVLLEGKRPWKPSLKVQMKMKEKSSNLSFGYRRRNSGSDIENSMGALKDIIKPDMVSKYADKMAEKPKERHMKNTDSKRHLSDNFFFHSVDNSHSVSTNRTKKSVDPLDRVAAKIEKLLKSQWEDRLSRASTQPRPPEPKQSPSHKTKTSPLSQWKSEQEQRQNQKRTKNIIRKARLQLKKRTLMKLRQPQSIALLNEKLKCEASTSPETPIQSSSLSSTDLVESPTELKYFSDQTEEQLSPELVLSCCICDLSRELAAVQHFYGRLSCEVCSKFFNKFIEAPKQYFCSKNGNCRSLYSTPQSLCSQKISNSRYRCKACWVKMCMLSFNVDSAMKERLLNHAPRLEAPPHKILLPDNYGAVDESPPALEVAVEDHVEKSENNQTKVLSNVPAPVVPEEPKQISSNETSVSDKLPVESVELNETAADQQRDEVKPPKPAARRGRKSNRVSSTTEPASNAIPAPPIISSDDKPDSKDACSGSVHASESPSVDVDVKKEEKDEEGQKVKEMIEESPSSDDKLPGHCQQPTKSSDLTVATSVVDPVVKPEEPRIRGPRVKHVCRRAAVVLGLPQATFSGSPSGGKGFNLSALPKEEKDKLISNDLGGPSTSQESSRSTKLSKASEITSTRETRESKSRVSVDILKKSSITIHKKQKKKRLLMKKSIKRVHKHAFKKPIKLTHKVLIKNQLKYSYKTVNKTSAVKSKGLRNISGHVVRSPKTRKVRCKECEGCLAEDCGRCNFCLDKKKFGGPNLIKQACMYRRCLRPVMPESAKKQTKAAVKSKVEQKPAASSRTISKADNRSSALPIAPSSPTPSLLDNSSCGSSCSSSSSSSSGSSGSSSSSSSSSSTSSTSSSSTGKSSYSSHNNYSSNCSTVESVFQSTSALEGSDAQPFDCLDNPAFGYDIMDSCDIASDYSFATDIDFGDSLAGMETNTNSNSFDGSYSGRGESSKSQGNGSTDQNELCDKGHGGDDNKDDDDEGNQGNEDRLVQADYWVGQDIEKILNAGFAVVSTEHIPLQSLCYMCGSAGEEKFIYCTVCCEPFHSYCVDEGTNASPLNIDSWCCFRCRTCAVCGLKSNLLKCNECRNSYHTDCLGSNYPSKPSKKKRLWVCPRCVRCKSCGSATSGTGSFWNFDSMLCSSCSKLKDRGNYCPLCNKCYKDDDYESEMMQCFKCNSWVHAKCEKITDEEYQILSCLPETVVYTCFACSTESPPLWRLAVADALKSGLVSVLSTLMSARCTRHFIRKGPSNNSQKLKYSIFKTHLPSSASNLRNLLPNLTKEKSSGDSTEQETSSCDVQSTASDSQPPSSESLKSESVMSSVNSAEDVGSKNENSVTSDCLSDSTVQKNDLSRSSSVSNISTADLIDAASMQSTSSLSSSYSSECTSETPVSQQQQDQKPVDSATVGAGKSLVPFNHLTRVRPRSSQKNAEDLLTVKRKLTSGLYKSVREFFDEIINLFNSGIYDGHKGDGHIAKVLLLEQIEKSFPWFSIDTKVWDTQRRKLPQGLLPEAVLPPYEDHVYAQYLIKDEKDGILQIPNFKYLNGIKRNDKRECVLCNMPGDDPPQRRGRLLYCGQDDWIHVNCALWSAEVFQKSDGSLQNVYPAITRGRQLRCEFCSLPGATVGCCIRGCPANYHYFCAREARAILQVDKKVFCLEHKNSIDDKIVKDNEFSVDQCTVINFEDIAPKWVKSSWQTGFPSRKFRIVIGSLTIENLGVLTSASDTPVQLIPVGFRCTRLFWSTKNPRQKVLYTCKTVEVMPEIAPSIDQSRNLTIQHSQQVNPVLSETELASQDGGTEYLCHSPKQEKCLFPVSASPHNHSHHISSVAKDVTLLAKCSEHSLDSDENRSVEIAAGKHSNNTPSKWEPKKCSLPNIIKKVCVGDSKFSVEELTKQILQSDSLSKVISKSSLDNRVVPDDLSIERTCCQTTLDAYGANSTMNDSEAKFTDENANVIASALHKTGIESYCRFCAGKQIKLNGSVHKFCTRNCPSELSAVDSCSGVVASDTKEKSVGISDAMVENSKGFCHSNQLNKQKESNKFRKLLDALSNGECSKKELLRVLSEKSVSDDMIDYVMKILKDETNLSGSKRKTSVLDEVAPDHQMSQTVLPVFEVKKTAESSSSISPSKNKLHTLQNSGSEQFTQNKITNSVTCNGFNGTLPTDKHPDAPQKPLRINGCASTVIDKVLAYTNNKNGCSKILNGVKEGNNARDACVAAMRKSSDLLKGNSQDICVYKCTKCKRSYRTNESYQKHVQLCDFEVDSSSCEEDDIDDNSSLSASSVLPGSSDKSSDLSSQSEIVCASQNLNYNLTSTPAAPPVPADCDLAPNTSNSEVMAYSNAAETFCNSHDEFQSLEHFGHVQATESHSLTNADSVVSTQKQRLENKKQTIYSRQQVQSQPQQQQGRPKKTYSVAGPYRSQVTPKTAPKHILPRTEYMGTSSFGQVQHNQPQPTAGFNDYQQIPVETCANVEIPSCPMMNQNFSDNVNVGYANNVYSNCATAEVVQVPGGTLIIPQKPEIIAPSVPTMNSIHVAPSPMLHQQIDIGQAPQFSYVGSITITNSQTVQFSVNLPGSVVPNIQLAPSTVLPQQNLAFNQPALLHTPVQFQPNSSMQFSSFDMQQINLQSSCTAGSLGTVVFPQQVPVQEVPNQVVYVEDPTAINAISAAPYGQAGLVMPMQVKPDPSDGYQTYITDSYQLSNAQVNADMNAYSTPKILDASYGSSVSICKPEEQLVQDPNLLHNNSANFPTPVDSSWQQIPPTAGQSDVTYQEISSTNQFRGTINESVESSRPASNSSIIQDQRGSPSVVGQVPNNSLVDILTKAAQQMISLSSKWPNKKTSSDASASESDQSTDSPQKKIRFAHTRKVAARKAQKLKDRQMRSRILMGSQPNPGRRQDCLQLKISAVPASSFQFIPSGPVQSDDNSRLSASPFQAFSVPSEAFPSVADVGSISDVVTSSSELLKKEEEECGLTQDNSNPIDERILLGDNSSVDGKSEEEKDVPKKPYIMYEVCSEDGFSAKSRDIHEIWKQIYENVQDARVASKMSQLVLCQQDVDGLKMLGLHSDNKVLTYLLEQLPGTENCTDYKFSFHKPVKKVIEISENPSGCARTEPFMKRKEYDMFNFLASEYRVRPVYHAPDEDEDSMVHKSSRRSIHPDQYVAMRFRHLKHIAKETVGVYRSKIHGRGLFCKRDINRGELVIEYAGEVIRSILSDIRERDYQNRGIGCYMFRIDDDEVVDATMHGNAARFINHSCEPNCYSKVIAVDGKKHIVIFAHRRIMKGEELTYDYKFPYEDDNKIPCSCNSRKCRKYLN